MKRVYVVYVLLFDENNEKVLMVKNIGESSSYYTLPGGAVEDGETLEEAAIREVKEETGVDVEVEGILTVSEAFFEKRGHHTILFTFKGKIIGGELNISYPEEIEEIAWIEPNLAESFIHIPKEMKGLLKNNSTVPYFHRGNIIH